MASAPLPPALEARLAALAVRVRRLRVIRGASWLVLAVLLAAGAVVLLDAAFSLSVLSRSLLQLAWLGLVAFLTWRLVVRPWREDVPFEDAARLVERRFPDLRERLLTVVSLREKTGPEHGSPQLLAGLLRETEQQTRNLNFNAAAPSHPAMRLGAVAGAIALLAIVAVAVVPGSGERLRRVGLPWFRPSVAVPYRVVVTSGSPVLRRGEPVTLSAYLSRTGTSAAVPDSAALVLHDASGERRLPMTGDGAAVFHVTLPAVSADFEYRVEVGPAASDWFAVLVADPVELADGSTAEVVPPPYAANFPPRTAPGLTELDGLQHSTAALHFRFNRPAAAAFLEWHADNAPPGPGQVIPLTIDDARLEASAVVPMTHNGTLRVVMLNENGPRKLRTETPIAVRVTPDAPPRFDQVLGVSSRSHMVRPTERVLIAFTATDDLGIATAELEYAVGPEFKPVRSPIPLTSAGTPRVEGRMLFDLAGKATEGQTIRLRVRVTDTRHFDALRLTPQEAVYPPAGWAEFTLSSSAPPLEQQEVFGQRDALRDVLVAVLKEVIEAHDDVNRLREETADRSPLPVDHRARIDQARDRMTKAADRLHDAAREAALTPELRPLASAVRAVAERPLRDAADRLNKAKTDNPADRVAALAAARADLADAQQKIEELFGRNVRVAQDRLDRRRLEALAADQAALAEKTRTGAPRKELAKEQAELLNRLRSTIAESESLRRGTESVSTREVRRLAADTRALLGAVRDLDAASRELNAETRKLLLVRAGEAQAEGIAAAGVLLARIETAARLAGVASPKIEDFRRVSDLIAQDRLVEALTELEKLAADLDKTADDFEKWAEERQDAKHAAKQLALWQEDVRTRFVVATKAMPFAQLPDRVKIAFRTEQRAIREATMRLKFPSDPSVAESRAAALLAIGRSIEELDGDGAVADVRMKSAVAELHQLADRAPSVPVRLAASRPELDKIRAELESSINTADQAIRALPIDRPTDAATMQGLAKKLTSVQEKQQKLAERLAAIDLPGFEARQARAVFALSTAAADLREGAPFDISASLAWSKRELDRLKQSLDTPPAVEDWLDDLIAKQTAIAKELAGPAPTPNQLEAIEFAQREIQKQLETLPVSEASVLLNDARDAVKLALAEQHDGSKPAEMLRRATAATDALKRLADRVNGAEPDIVRVRRLAANRTAAAEEAKQLAGKPRNPNASDAAKRQLQYEVEELTHTRVGPAAQATKHRVLKLYAELRNQAEPDRQAGAQAALAAALTELAAKMADVKELTVARPREVPAAVAAEDAFLPSKALAADLRNLAKQQRTVRDRVNTVNAEQVRLTKPADVDPLGPLEQRQRAVATGLAELTRNRITDRDLASAENAGQALESANTAARWLSIGRMRPAKEAGEQTAQRLRQLAAAGAGKPWGKIAADLVAKQDAIVAELNGFLADPSIATARHAARHEELAKQANTLAAALDKAASEAPVGDPSVLALVDAAEKARAAEKLLHEAAQKTRDGLAGEANKLRIGAGRLLNEAADTAATAAGVPRGKPLPPEPDASALAAGDALRESELAMQTAVKELAPRGNAAAAGRAMQKSADALNRAAKAVASGPTPDSGTGAAVPATTGEITPDQLDRWGAVWGELPADVQAKVLQDLKARYGDDYARVIKLYFEHLAERR